MRRIGRCLKERPIAAAKATAPMDVSSMKSLSVDEKGMRGETMVRVKTALVMVGSVALAGACAYAFHALHKADDGTGARLKALETEVTELRGRPAVVVSVPSVPQPGPSLPSFRSDDPPAPPANAAHADPSTPPPSEAEVRQAPQTHFESQGVDPHWSRDTQRKAEEKLNSLLPADSRLLSVECRESICRVESEHQDIDTFRAFVRSDLFSPELRWEGPMMATVTNTDSNGRVSSVAYLGRDRDAFAEDFPQAAQ
jgi:hypothetical protein